jgi:hypothetical protein
VLTRREQMPRGAAYCLLHSLLAALRPLLPAAVLLLLSCLTALAQETRYGEVFGGYSLLYGDSIDSARGWHFSGTGNLPRQQPAINNWFGIQGDFSGYHRFTITGEQHLFNFQFGPQFSRRASNFTLVAHALLGGSHFRVGNLSETGLAWAAGGSIDLDIRPGVAIRIVQLDYQGTHLFDSIQNNTRFSSGLVIRFVGFVRPNRKPAPGSRPTPTTPR